MKKISIFIIVTVLLILFFMIIFIEISSRRHERYFLVAEKERLKSEYDRYAELRSKTTDTETKYSIKLNEKTLILMSPANTSPSSIVLIGPGLNNHYDSDYQYIVLDGALFVSSSGEGDHSGDLIAILPEMEGDDIALIITYDSNGIRNLGYDYGYIYRVGFLKYLFYLIYDRL